VTMGLIMLAAVALTAWLCSPNSVFTKEKKVDVDEWRERNRRLHDNAGFWRRYLAVMIDLVILSLLFQIIGAILFVATSGWIQQSFGVTFTNCEIAQTVPDGLFPPPPAGANFARQCRVYFFGAETARRLEVGRLTTEGNTANIVSQSYMLDRDGQPINGVSIDWIVMVIFIAYLLAMETRFGATLGNLVMRIRVVDAAAPDHFGVPLRKIIFRYLILLTGFLPLIVVGPVYFALYGGDIEAVAGSDVFTWLTITGIAAIGWGIVLSVRPRTS
jgi:uncharacterized RDD family membrane protein YckC